VGKLRKIGAIADIASTLYDIYDTWQQRKLQRADMEKDEKIRRLEAEVEDLKKKPDDD